MASFSDSSLLDHSTRQDAEMEQTTVENVWLIFCFQIYLLETMSPERDPNPMLPQRHGHITSPSSHLPYGQGTVMI